MPYILRDANGVMKAKLSDKLADVVMTNAEGKVRPAKFKNSAAPLNVFELLNDCFVGDDATVRVYLWKGDLLIPEV
jgi:hypothetical protein